MDGDGALDKLLAVLGPGRSRQQAARLLQDAGGSVEGAVTLFFAGGGSDVDGDVGDDPAGGRAGPSTARSSADRAAVQLQAILGGSQPPSYIAELLRRCASGSAAGDVPRV